MSNEHSTLDDTNQLDAALKHDSSGERLGELLRYFDEAIAQSQARLNQPQASEERQMTGQLIEGFQAAQRILSHAWKSVHTPASL